MSSKTARFTSEMFESVQEVKMNGDEDNIIVLNKGEIEYRGSFNEFIENYENFEKLIV